MNNVNDAVTQALIHEIGCNEVENLTETPHGVLNQCHTYNTNKGKFFVKVNDRQTLAMYEAEAQGLQSIKDTETLRVPKPYYFGEGGGHCFLILEHLELTRHTASSQSQLGTQLAQMHLAQGQKKFGYEVDNTIGTTPQKNPWTEEWVDFFVHQRLDFQMRLVEKQYGDSEIRKKGNVFLEKYPRFFDGLEIVPSLLHGDLWSGNTAADMAGNPVVYDPAVYYGHHEADFGILLMFGGFTSDFHQAYRELIPQTPGFEERQLGYQLYHYLNHYSLFGSSYRPSCMAILERVGR